MKNIVYATLLLVVFGLMVFSLSKEYIACKQQGYTEIQFSVSSLFCTKHLPNGLAENYNRNTGAGFFIPVLLLLSVVFYRKTWDSMTRILYNNFAKQNPKREAFFIGVGIFLYCFIPILTSIFFGFGYSVKPIGINTLWALLGGIFICLGVAVPLGASIYSGKKWLDSETPKKIFSKMPLQSMAYSIIWSIAIEILLLSPYGVEGYPLAGFAWLFYCWMYILGIGFLSLILATYLHTYKFSQNQLLLKWIATILLVAPYVIASFSVML